MFNVVKLTATPENLIPSKHLDPLPDSIFIDR